MAYRRRYRRRGVDKTSMWVVLGLLIVLVALLVPAGTQLESFAATPILVVLGIGILSLGGFLLYYIAKQQLKRLRALRLADIDTMDGVVFERYIGELLKFQGFHIEFTKASGDLGGDIIARLGDDRYCIQMKRYSKDVDRTAISDAVGAMTYYGCSRSMVVTNRNFTPGAKTLAVANRTELVDRQTLIDWIVAFQDAGKTHADPQAEINQTEHRDWASKGESMTEAQSKYLYDLSKDAGVPFDNTLTKYQASRRIDELKAKLHRE